MPFLGPGGVRALLRNLPSPKGSYQELCIAGAECGCGGVRPGAPPTGGRGEGRSQQLLTGRPGAS